MQPKTKLQKLVATIQPKLAPVTDVQKQWAFDNCFERTGLLTKKKASCLECGHQWAQEANLIATIVGCTCPSCEAELKMTSTRKKNLEEAAYCAVLTTLKGFQVVRMLYLKRYCKAGEPARLECDEVMQHWIDRKGGFVLYSKTVAPMTGYYDTWSHGSSLDMRDHTTRGAMLRIGLTPERIYPKSSILPEIKRNGFKGNYYGQSPSDFFKVLLSDSRAETLLKARQVSMLKYLFNKYNGSKTLDSCWNSVKICIRNGYIIKDASMWTDYVSLLAHFNKDLLSSHFVCPVDLRRSHDKLVDKRRRIIERAKFEEMRKNIAEAQIEYQQQKGKFFGLSFSNGKLTVRVLESVEEFQAISSAHRHCVFSGGYYKKSDSLVMAAVAGDQLIETIELSLSTLKIIQARGPGNKATEHHSEIIDLVNSNVQLICSRIKQAI